ncbi:uncharacterized protein PG986_002478 [Apiospora aurea]|uniref:Uncharacterized protein n=1 Tax=Apiospora aurea TaxID=335848 RepID=A0ABR1QNY2_9PEZI
MLAMRPEEGGVAAHEGQERGGGKREDLPQYEDPAPDRRRARCSSSAGRVRSGMDQEPVTLDMHDSQSYAYSGPAMIDLQSEDVAAAAAGLAPII